MMLVLGDIPLLLGIIVQQVVYIQLHLVDFRQRLAAMLPQVQQQLQAADDVSA